MRSSIFLKLLLFAFGVALIPITIAGVTFLRDTRNELKSNVNDELVTVDQGIADELDRRYADQWLAPLRLLARTLDDPDLSTKAKLSLLTGISAIPEVVALQLSISNAVQPVVITRDDAARRLRDRGLDPLAVLVVPYDRISKTPGQGRVYNAGVTRIDALGLELLDLVITLEQSVDGSHPLLLARIDLSRLWEELTRHPFARNGRILIADPKGRPLFTSDGVETGQNPLVDRALGVLGSTMRSAEVFPYTSDEGREMLGGYTLAKKLDWPVMVERDAQTAYLPVHQMLRRLLLWILLGIVVAVPGAWFFSRRLSRPIVTIEAIAQRVGGGDFATQVPALRRRDEIGRLGIEINRMIDGLRERERVKDIFGRFQSREVVARLLGTPGALELGGERRQITIMMTDLRGFTAISEQLPPEQVVQMLNHYFEPMVDICVRYQGTITAFIGDALLVLFGAPVRQEGHATQALACAIEMQLAMTEVNRRIQADGLPTLEMGIGLHTGEAVVGNVGSEKRAQFTAIGSDVNLASRLESYTVGGEILISDAAREAVGEILEIASTQYVQPKGVKGEIPVHKVSGLGGNFALRLAQEDEEREALAIPIPLTCAALEGKHLNEEGHLAEIVALGPKSAELRGGKYSPLTNLKLNLRDPDLAPLDIYAKVSTATPDALLIRFTSVPQAVASFFSLRIPRKTATHSRVKTATQSA